MGDFTPHIGLRRSKGWWEPIYAPELEGHLTLCDWTFQNTTGSRQAYLPAEALKPLMTEGEVYKLGNLTFESCDFQGCFRHLPSILIDGCRFHGCDFAFSQWYRVTFRNCEFRECSIALASFEECEFRDCTWKNIGFSGSKTSIIKSFFTNPKSLVCAGVSHSRPGDSSGEHKAYQRFRLEGTKAHLARSLLYSHEVVGDDKVYYDTAKLHDLQQTQSRISESWFLCRYGKSWIARCQGFLLPFWLFEAALLRIVGLSNGWGSRLFQPLILLLFVFIGFGFLYTRLHHPDIVLQPWQKAFDIMLIAGYTNQSDSSQPLYLRVFEGAQLVISVFLYTIFFSASVSRLSRTR